MSDYAWFAVKNMCIIAATLVAYMMIGSAWVFLMLAFLSSWESDDCKCGKSAADSERKEK